MKPELQKPEPERSYQSSFWPELTNPNVRVFGTHEPEPDDAYVIGVEVVLVDLVTWSM